MNGPGRTGAASAMEIASGVRRGELSAAGVLEEHLARIAEREPDVHAFNFVMEDQARARAAEIDRLVAAGQDPGPLAGVPVALKDLLCTRGVPTTCSSRILEGWLPPYDATVVSRLSAAGAVIHREDQHGRVRHGLFDRALGVRPHPQPPRLEPGAGRFFGWQRRCGGRGLRPARPRQRHRRLDPPARSPLRRSRGQAHLRPGLPLRARSRLPARSTRSGRSPPPWPMPPRSWTRSPGTTSWTRPACRATTRRRPSNLGRGR